MGINQYSQNNEEQVIVNYFNGFVGNLLSIGENDGKTLSNALRLIELGWYAHLIEPSPTVFPKLQGLHINNPRVTCHNFALGDNDSKMEFYESGHHFADKSDLALLSTLNPSEMDRWKNVEFKEIYVDVKTYQTFLKQIKSPAFDFISIDAEGVNIEILKQINLDDTLLLCIEHNSIFSDKQIIVDYCLKHGLDNLIYESGENLIIGKVK